MPTTDLYHRLQSHTDPVVQRTRRTSTSCRQHSSAALQRQPSSPHLHQQQQTQGRQFCRTDLPGGVLTRSHTANSPSDGYVGLCARPMGLRHRASVRRQGQGGAGRGRRTAYVYSGWYFFRVVLWYFSFFLVDFEVLMVLSSKVSKILNFISRSFKKSLFKAFLM